MKGNILTPRGHIHAFWILYKKMRAEEMYGATGFIYVGNGEYQPANDRRECLLQARTANGSGAEDT